MEAAEARSIERVSSIPRMCASRSYDSIWSRSAAPRARLEVQLLAMMLMAPVMDKEKVPAMVPVTGQEMDLADQAMDQETDQEMVPPPLARAAPAWRPPPLPSARLTLSAQRKSHRRRPPPGRTTENDELMF